MTENANARYRTRCWESVVVGDILPPVELDITYTRAIQNVAAGRDWMRGHHDPDYARHQGQATVFLNTTFHQALIDRAVTDWSGPHGFIRRRILQMIRPLLAGDKASVTGHIVQLLDDSGPQHGSIVAEVALASGTGLCSKARVVLRLPRRNASG